MRRSYIRHNDNRLSVVSVDTVNLVVRIFEWVPFEDIVSLQDALVVASSEAMMPETSWRVIELIVGFWRFKGD